VAAERESQDQPDDHTADAARLGAPDVRMGATQNRADPGDRETPSEVPSPAHDNT
jgi:hypothetical protein